MASHHAIKVGVRRKRHGLLQAASLARTGDVATSHALGGVSGLPDNVAAARARLSRTPASVVPEGVTQATLK